MIDHIKIWGFPRHFQTWRDDVAGLSLTSDRWDLFVPLFFLCTDVSSLRRLRFTDTFVFSRPSGARGVVQLSGGQRCFNLITSRGTFQERGGVWLCFNVMEGKQAIKTRLCDERAKTETVRFVFSVSD